MRRTSFFANFRLQIVVRSTLLAGALAAFFYSLFRDGWRPLASILALAAFYLIFSLIRYVEGTNRRLTRFFEAIHLNDFSQSFGQNQLGGPFQDLNVKLNQIMRQFVQSRGEKEAQHRYLQTVVQHVGIGLIAFLSDGRVDMINTAAKRMLKIPHLKNVRALPPQMQPLLEALRQLPAGEKTLVKITDQEETIQFSLTATEFKLQDQTYTLVSLQNIHNELEEKEAEAWQNLTRVLTHEIMNSITPIASMASTAGDLLDSDGAEDASKNIGPIRHALQTIKKRSQGLMQFVQAYRHLTLIPKPQFRIVPVAELFQRLENLMRPTLERQNITFSSSIDPESLEITADAGLIEQVLINLLLNAAQALEKNERPEIALNALLNERGRVIIQVSDNGPGIEAEALEKIFIPFFTTKKKGSGIGLSFSRQVMRLHRGFLWVHSRPGERTVFTLRF